jgi:hypothetical protein
MLQLLTTLLGDRRRGLLHSLHFHVDETGTKYACHGSPCQVHGRGL